MSDVYLKYVGKKPWTRDGVGGTGIIWNGNGDIQPVPEAAAEKLLKYPDQWVVATVREALAKEQAKPVAPVVVVPPKPLAPFDDGLASAAPKAKAKAAPKAKANAEKAEAEKAEAEKANAEKAEAEQ